MGYSSLFDYCVRKLGYSEGSAYKSIKTGEVALSDIEGKTRREVEALEIKPIEIRREKERVRRVKIKAKADESLPSLFEAKEIKPMSQAKAPEERFEITFTLTKEEDSKLEKAKRKFSHALNGDSSNRGLFLLLLRRAMKPRKIKARAARTDTRRIPEPVKREVYERDNGQCTYVATNGRSCSETKFLEYDHVLAFSLGGKSEASNLRLRCCAHNRLEADKTFGEDFMAKKIKASKTTISVTNRQYLTSPEQVPPGGGGVLDGVWFVHSKS